MIEIGIGILDILVSFWVSGLFSGAVAVSFGQCKIYHTWIEISSKLWICYVPVMCLSENLKDHRIFPPM